MIIRRTLTTMGLTALTVGLLSTAAGAQDSDTLSAQLDGLNGSGDSGTAWVQLDGNQVTVTVEAQNTSPGAPHAQHIHIGGNNTCPTPDADQDGDGLINTAEGQPAYGQIQVALTTEGDTSVDSGLAVDRMPVADDSGAVTYERTFDLPEGVTPDDVRSGVVVQHGFAESDMGEDDAAYDGPDSELMEGVPAEATLPVTCGALAAAPAGGVQTGGGGTAGTTDTTQTGLLALGVLGLAGGGVFLRRRMTQA